MMTFMTLHITLTAATVAVLTLAVGIWRLPRPVWRQALIVALLSGAAVFLWRLSANTPDLNDDGLPGVSANDWAAPVIAYLSLSVYADLRKPCPAAAFREVRALAALACLVINVVTI